MTDASRERMAPLPTGDGRLVGLDGVVEELARATDDFAVLPEVATRAVGNLLRGTTVLWVLDTDQRTIRMLAGWHPEAAARLDLAELGEGRDLQLGDGFLGTLLEQRQTFFRKQLDLEELKAVNSSYLEYFARHGLSGMIIVPLTCRGQRIGMLGISRHAGQPAFEDVDLTLLRQVAGHVALAVDNARLLALARQEIAERSRSERRLRYQATHDSLTGLPNRLLLRERLDELVAADEPAGHTLLFLDLDGFKDVNDALGHEAGDDVLRQLAARLMSAVPSSGLLARLGGDEFAVLLDGTATDPVEVAGALRAALVPPAWVGGQPVHLGASVGVAAVHADEDAASDLMRRADLAMYRAKQTGEGVCVFDAEVDAHRANRLSRVDALRRAIAGGDLRVFWQPIVDVVTGKVLSAEALVRWQRGDLLVPPDDFVPLAEQSGLILPLTQWVVAEVAAAMAAWAAEGRGLRTAVNLATSVLAERRVADDLAGRFDEHGVEPSTVTLEISEASLLNPRAREGLRQCAERGFDLAIDDFGTGYASFGYLKDLAVDEVKIDRSFVRALQDDPRDAAIVGSIGFVAERLGLRTVAEGVEHPLALERLAELGISAAQGFLISRPMPREHFGQWLTERQEEV